MVITERLTKILAIDGFNPMYLPEFFDAFEALPNPDHLICYRLQEAYKAYDLGDFAETRRNLRIIQARILSHETSHQSHHP